ncbi:plexin-C1 [Protopterus annectens]|uniref:plexin-C1 n=1 Tax=Protopterus annectens TaxID=7888 RepID=UPI001CFBE328|nr:plexin-C1 [Protopterus annectens]
MTSVITALHSCNPIWILLIIKWAFSQEVFNFTQNINNIATSSSRVFVATDNYLYQLSNTLHLENKVQTGPQNDSLCEDTVNCPSSLQTQYNKLLLVYEDDKRLLTCGTLNFGNCQIRDLSNISNVNFNRSVFCNHQNASTVGFFFKHKNSTYLAVAMTYTGKHSGFFIDDDKFKRDTQQKLFAVRYSNDLKLKSDFFINYKSADFKQNTVHFVNGFQRLHKIFFLYYTYNYTDGKIARITNGPFIAAMDIRKDEHDFHGFLSYKQAILNCNDKRKKLLSASPFSLFDGETLIAAVFSTEESGANRRDTTAVCVFNLTQMDAQTESNVSPEILKIPGVDSESYGNLNPIKNSETLIHPSLSSVLVQIVQTQVVLLLGTNDGQLMKVVLDENFKPRFHEVLAENKVESPVFYRMLLDPTNSSFIYLPTTNEVKRVQVANCAKHASCKDCLSLSDPYCGWCSLSKRCTFQSSCLSKSSKGWISILSGIKECPDIQILPLKKPFTEAIRSVSIGMTVSGSIPDDLMADGTCLIKTILPQKELCRNSTAGHQSRNCSCNISEKKPDLKSLYTLEAVFMKGSWSVSKRFSLRGCSEIPSIADNSQPCATCVKAHCQWCTQEQMCVSELSVCNGSTPIKDKVACPYIDKLMMSSTNSMTVIIKNGEELKNMNLYCKMGNHSLKSTWINRTAIQCSGIQVAFSAMNHAVPVDVVYNSSFLLDNPYKLSVKNCTFSKTYCTANKTQGYIVPGRISILGKQSVTLHGCSITEPNIKVILKGSAGDFTEEAKVQEIKDGQLTFIAPRSYKDIKKVCATYDRSTCLNDDVFLSYVSMPECHKLSPHISWASGGRTITITGKNLDVIDKVKIYTKQVNYVKCSANSDKSCVFHSPPYGTVYNKETSFVELIVENSSIPCSMRLQYSPDPVFRLFPHSSDTCYNIKDEKYQNLNIKKEEIIAETHLDGKHYKCDITEVKNWTISCCVLTKLSPSNTKLKISLGNFTFPVETHSSNYPYLAFLLIILLPVLLVAYCVIKYKTSKLTRKMSQERAEMECLIRKGIREGFADLQTDGLRVVNRSGTIPFLDYKYFAIRTFFPESGNIAPNLTEDLITASEPFSNSRNIAEDEAVSSLSAMLDNKQFLITLIHTLEEQKSFSIKDKCAFASYLTIALHSKLVYLTSILENLLQDLMDKHSKTEQKLLLRRTESVVEKLLTNWMSICVYGFLRETVGEPLYLLVTCISQRINCGPVDAVTWKALNTLNEDWLLWQVTEFNAVKLNVSFEINPVNENQESVTQNIQVEVLDCDTIGQAKEKIIQAYLNTFGYAYRAQLKESSLELQTGQENKELRDTDSSSLVLENGITKLNTIGHYKISDGAEIKVIKKAQRCNSDSSQKNGDSGKLYHLILPDSETIEEKHGGKNKAKQTFQVKELYLTKLLSTKGAIHFDVETLFKTIWSLPKGKAPIAIKYFFDFLDTQAENKRITDPDVMHIWKTNSLPLRFWINILKNPQFVFDIEKNPNLDGCLSVIAQAFMDAFSLTEQQLGKQAPTNKLLYAKDIPLYKTDVRNYFQLIKESPSISRQELEEFLHQESEKHENEFKEHVALIHLYKYISKYFNEINAKLGEEQNCEDMKKQLAYTKALFDDKKTCAWIS